MVNIGFANWSHSFPPLLPPTIILAPQQNSHPFHNHQFKHQTITTFPLLTIEMSKAIQILVILALLATVALSFDVGNCNSCPFDCDVYYISVGGEVIASYSCIDYYWRHSWSCAPKKNTVITCSSPLYRMPECYCSKYGVSSNSKCDGAAPAPILCPETVGCNDGERCKNDVCVPLPFGHCDKDSDCKSVSGKPHCSSGGKCISTEFDGPLIWGGNSTLTKPKLTKPLTLGGKGHCIKDSDCKSVTGKPYCSSIGKCVATEMDGPLTLGGKTSSSRSTKPLTLGAKSSANLPLAGVVVAVALVGAVMF